MNVAFELPEAQAEKLRREADRLGVSPADLARAALADLLSAIGKRSHALFGTAAVDTPTLTYNGRFYTVNNI